MEVSGEGLGREQYRVEGEGRGGREGTKGGEAKRER